MRVLALLATFGLAACTANTDDDVLDMRREFPEPPDGAFVLTSPEYTIPAGAERQMCMAATYDGPDVGITGQYNYQPAMGHHVTLFGTSATVNDLPDGEVWDCTSTEALDMTSLEPVIIGGTIEYQDDGVLNAFDLPTGMAAPLEQGQRLVLQSHYVNVSDQDVLVQDEAHMLLTPEDEVETWAAPLVNTVTHFTIPAGSDAYAIDFDCTFEDTYNVLYLGGHLHEWGKSFKTERTNAGGTETIYEVQEWEPVLRDAPMYQPYDEGEFQIVPGDTFTTTCTWFNHEDHDLEFPQEMCVTFGMIYPSRVPVICDPS